MTPVFADASYYLALLSQRDQHHDDAVRQSAMLRAPVVVTEFVLIEVTNALAEAASRRLAIALWRQLQSDPSVTIVPASATLVSRGLDRYSHRLDKNWSLTDCISFVTMDDHGLSDALTADHHFEQAGFRRADARIVGMIWSIFVFKVNESGIHRAAVEFRAAGRGGASSIRRRAVLGRL